MRVLHRMYEPLFDMALRIQNGPWWSRRSNRLVHVPVSAPWTRVLAKTGRREFWIRATLPTSIALEIRHNTSGNETKFSRLS